MRSENIDPRHLQGRKKIVLEWLNKKKRKEREDQCGSCCIMHSVVWLCRLACYMYMYASRARQGAKRMREKERECERMRMTCLRGVPGRRGSLPYTVFSM